MGRDKIIRELSDYIEQQGGFPSDWYVGVAEDARSTLFEDHNVDLQRGRWIFQAADSSSEAKEVSEHFLIVVGTDGEEGDGDLAARQVYAYRKSFRTSP
jgi:hypothetical protein